MNEVQLSRWLARLAQSDPWRNAPDLARAIRHEYQRNKDFATWPAKLQSATRRLADLAGITV